MLRGNVILRPPRKKYHWHQYRTKNLVAQFHISDAMTVRLRSLIKYCKKWNNTHDLTFSTQINFPDSFSSADRCQIHIICEQLKPVHKSTGEVDERRQVVTRIPTTPDEVICVIPSVTPISDNHVRSFNSPPTSPVLAIDYPQAVDRRVHHQLI
jgi:hypothetical protein